MAEFFSNFRHLFEDINDEQYTSQLKSLNHIVEQSRRGRIQSEKRRLLQQAIDYSTLTSAFSPPNPQMKILNDQRIQLIDPNSPALLYSHNIDSLLRVPFIQNQQQDKLSFNKNGSMGGLLNQGDNNNNSAKIDGKAGGIARKQQLMQYQQQQAQESMLANYKKTMAPKGGSIGSLMKGNTNDDGYYKSSAGYLADQGESYNQFGPSLLRKGKANRRNNRRGGGGNNNNNLADDDEDDEPNLFQDPMKNPKLKSIMLGNSMKFQEELDVYQESLSAKTMKNKKYIGSMHALQENQGSYLKGQMIHNGNNQSNIYNQKGKSDTKDNIFGAFEDNNPMDSSINEGQGRKRKRGYELPRQNAIEKGGNIGKDFAENMREKYDQQQQLLQLGQERLRDEDTDSSKNMSSLELQSALIYEKLRQEMDMQQRQAKVKQILIQQQQGNTSDNEIQAIHKGLDRYQDFKRSMGNVTYTPDPNSEAAIKASPIERRFISSRHQEVNKIN